MTKSAESKRSSFFRIHVRPDLIPTKAKIGKVKDDEFMNESYEVDVNTPIQYIPNYYEARVMKVVKDGKYNGEFKFQSELTDKEKEQPLVKVGVRFLPDTTSLDSKWQEENGFKPQTDEIRIGWALQGGKIAEWKKESVEPHFERFLQNHEGHALNQFRDRESTVLFKIIDDEPKKNELINDLELQRQLLDLQSSILNEKNIEHLKFYAHILKIPTKYEEATLKVEIKSKLDAIGVDALDLISNYQNQIDLNINQLIDANVLSFDKIDGKCSLTEIATNTKLVSGFSEQELIDGKSFYHMVMDNYSALLKIQKIKNK